MTGNDDAYFTIAGEIEREVKIERSRFIARAAGVDSEGGAKAFIGRIQQEHRQATHNCFAYRLGLGNNEVVYFSDAGEPWGTAGRPILGAIIGLDLTNVVVVVTRYFGGRKLGVRGLIEAYGRAAHLALEAGVRVKKVLTREMSIRCSYSELDRLLYLLNNCGGKVLTAEYGSDVYLKVTVPRTSWEEIRKLFPNP